MCRLSDGLTLVCPVMKHINGWLDDAAGIRQVENSFVVPFLSDNYKDSYKTLDLHSPMYASQYSIDYPNVTLI